MDAKLLALIQVGDLGKNARYNLDIPTGVTGGVLKLNFNGHETVDIPYPPSREDIAAAMADLTPIGSTDHLDIVGLRGGPFYIELKGELAAQPLPLATYPFTADGSALSPPTELTITQPEVGKSPMMISLASQIWDDLANESNEKLKFLYLKKNLIEALLGTSHKYVDNETSGKKEWLSQQSNVLLKMLGAVKSEIDGILNPPVAAQTSSNNVGVITGKIFKRTTNGLQYGVMGKDENGLWS